MLEPRALSINDWMICISIFMPAVKNSTKAKIIEIIMDTFIFLYFFALIFLRIANFIVLICELNLKIIENIPTSILDWSILSKIIDPNIINKNIVLNRNTCRFELFINTEYGIQ